LNDKCDPDDVSILFIKVTNNEDKSNRPQYPLNLDIIDKTEEFFPDFSVTVDLPWGESYSYGKKKEEKKDEEKKDEEKKEETKDDDKN